MSHFKKSLVSAFLLIALCVSLFLLAACDKGGSDTPTPKPDDQTKTDYGIDNVYFMTEGDDEYLFTITGNAFMLSGLNGDQSGTFTYEDGVLTLKFKEGDSTTASAKIEDGVLTLTYNGSTYRMLQRSKFTVTYDVDGGSAVASQQVLNGEYATKPQDPKKDGYAFIGWYTDKDYTSAFVFDSVAVKKDTTVYARFEQLTGKSEYTATLVGGDASYAPAKTVNGVLYNLPTPAAKDGAAFIGWWMSDYQKPDKLTAQYEGQTLTQDVTLYARYEDADGAPVISVTSTGISWNSLGTNIAYHVTVQLGDTVVKSTDANATRYAFDFSAAAAGDYTVTVTGNGKTATAYYRNKGLDRVSNFRVVSSGVLVFDPVAHAESYVITAVCGNPNHKHIAVNNGNSTNYIFANCDMPQDGITFIVTAKAKGYLDSTSTYIFYQGLSAVNGVEVSNEKITWNPVENAMGYLVSLSKDGETYTDYYVTSGTSYDITGVAAGLLYVKVKPVSTGYYAAPADAVNFEKTVLARPSGVTLSGTKLVWNAVAGATSYKVTINGIAYDAPEAAFVMNSDVLTDGIDTYEVTVQAIAADAQNNSPVSGTVTVNYSMITEVTYRDGYLYWSPVLNASKYIIRVGTSGAEIEVPATAAFAPVPFTESGEVKVSVCSENENGERSAWVSATVEVFEILLDVRGGAAVTSLYKAFGDSLTLPETTREGYDFVGWYLVPNGVTGGKAYTSDRFDGNGDLVLYANWSAKKYTVTLNPGENGTVGTDTVTVTYGKLNTLPTANCTDATKTFVGWFSEPNGGGIRYFDDKGEALFKWNNANDNVTLYAHYAEILSYKEIDNGKAYSVSKGPYGIGNLTEITIPATYNGKPVTTIEASAFISCNTMQVINIPNTIESINTGLDGKTASCFQGCYKLTAVNIYKVEGAIEPKYFSVDGVLYCTEYGDTQIRYCPYARTGILKIAEGTTSIPIGVFSSIKMSEVQIPHTVTYIGSNAFSGSYLKKVVFLAAPEGTDEVPLKMEDKAFYYCRSMTEITLPSRITEFTANTIASCYALTSIDIVGEGGLYSAKGEEGRKVLCTADGTTLIFCPQGMAGEFTIPSGIETIGEGSFSGCKDLRKVIIPGYVTTIAKNAFNGNSGITDVEMEEEGQPLTICEAAFYGCDGLTKITLPARLVKLEVNAFGATSSLTEVTINAMGASAGEGKDPTVDFAVGAFTTTDGRKSYVTDVTLGDNVPYFDIPGVLGKKLQNIYVSDTNPNYSSVDGVLFDKAVTKVAFYPIERVGDYALPETVIEIGAGAFQGRTELTGITIGKNVKSIGANAFEGCEKLASVTFTDGGTSELSIEDYAFKGCKVLAALKLPTSLRTIGAYAFQSCTALTTLTVPEGVTRIKEGAFASCWSLESVSLPSTLQEIQMATKKTNTIGNDDDKGSCNIFRFCSSLTTITMPAANQYFSVIDNILYQKAAKTVTDGAGEESTVYVEVTLLFCPQKKAGSSEVTVPGTVTTVKAWAFHSASAVESLVFGDMTDADATFTIEGNAFYASALTQVTLPKGLTTIAKELFKSCYTLEAITIPSTVTSIENGAFRSCTSLTTLIFAAPGKDDKVVPLVIEDAASYDKSPFYGCTKLTNIVFPERMTVLGNYAFAGKDASGYGQTDIIHAIKSVTFPSTLERIGQYAFYMARNLTSVTFADKTVLKDSTSPAIGNYAFAYCTALESIALPAGDTQKPYSIGESALYRTGLTSVTIPAGVGALGKRCLYWNEYLTSVTFLEGAKPTFGDSVFDSCYALPSITLPEGTTEISPTMFKNCKLLTSITIPSTVTTIGDSAFSDCKALKTIVFSTYENDGKAYSRVASIGAGAFTSTALTSFEFPTLETGALTLGKNLFAGCTQLASVTISKSVGSIDGVLAGCSSIKSFTVDPENQNFSAVEGDPILYNKDQTAYRYIVGLLVGEFRIGDKIKEISANVFENQIALTKLTIPANVVTIGDSAFRGCALLETVVFEHSSEKPSQLSTLGKELFKNCYELNSVTLPGNMTVLPESMFHNCYKLPTVTLPDTLTIISKNAFYGSGLATITIPAKVATIGDSAFYGSTSGGLLTTVNFATLSDGTTSLATIANNAFKYQALESITLPKSLTSLGTDVFSNCKGLVSASLENTALTVIPKNTFINCTSLATVKLPAGLTAIGAASYSGANAFSGCTSLKEITLPDTVTVIGNSAFTGCISLETVNISADSALTTIGTYAFQNCESLKSISLPASIATIGTTTFKGCKALTTFTIASGAKTLTKIDTSLFEGCESLTSIAIPDSVTSLGSKAFLGCTALKSVTFGSGSKLDTILASCFEKSGLESITIPKGVTVLGTSKTSGSVASTAKQFLDCVNLKSVTFLGNLKLLGGYVFQNCSSLTSVSFPASVTQIGNYCFDGCTQLATATFASGTSALKIGTYAFRNTGLTAFEVPGRATSLGKYALSGCESLATVTFEAGTKALTLGDSIFENCTALTSVALPDTVTAISESAFYGCEKLTTLTTDKVTSIGDSAFMGCSSLATITLPATLTSIDNSAFRDCSALSQIALPESLTSISTNAFMGAGLTSVTIPKNCTSIGNNAFGYCHSLMNFSVAEGNTTFTTFGITENETVLMKLGAEEGNPSTIIAAPAKVTGTVTWPENCTIGGYALNGMMTTMTTLVIPEGATEIPDYAFIGSSLESVTLPSTLTKIGKGAFSGSKLKNITIPAAVTELGDSAFKNCTSLTTITVAGESQLTTLGTYVFAGSGLTSITLPAGVTHLYKEYSASYTFADCASLTSVTFLGEITELNGYAFQNCTALQSFTIPSTVKVLGNYLFAGSGLTSITIPGTLERMHTYTKSYLTKSGYTFQDCTALKTVIIENGFKYINGSSFKGCTALTSVTFPASVTYVGANSFEDCTALTAISFPKDMEASIGDAAFKNCTSLSDVTFATGSKITGIGSNAFVGTALTSIEIPASMTSIGASAFAGTALTSIEIPASVTTIGASAFADCTTLTSVTFATGSQVNSIGASAFKGTGLTSITLPENVETLTLGTSLFEGCASLSSITLGKSVKEISATMFLNCTSLASLTIPANVTALGKEAFRGSGLTSITIPATVTKYGSSMFMDCLKLATVVYEDGCTRIESSTFAGCTALTSVTLPDTMTYIGMDAFEGCTSLSVIEIPASVVSLYRGVFKGWTSAQTIRVKAPKSLSIGWTRGINSGWDEECLATIVWDYGTTTTTTTTND